MSLSWYGASCAGDFVNWGPLTVVWPLLEKMDIANIIDRHVPPDPQLEYSHGRVLQLLLAARLYHPTALMNVSTWARHSGVELLADIPADKLNDDRLGRSLDALFEQRHSVLACLAAHVMQSFPVPKGRLHYDTTHLTFAGVYAAAEAIEPTLPLPPLISSANYPPAHITHGYLDKRKMVHAGVCALIDELGAVPIYGHMISGNRNGSSAIAEQTQLLQNYLPLDAVLMVSDRGTFSARHLLALQDAGHSALCSVSWADYRSLFQQQRPNLRWRRASFLSVEQQRRRKSGSALPHEYYDLAVHKHSVCDADSKRSIDCRVIFVFSTADKKAQAANRQAAIAKISAGLEKIKHAVARGHPTTKLSNIPARVAKLFGSKAAARYFSWSLEPLSAAEQAALPPPSRGSRRPRHRFVFACDEAAAQADGEDDGYYALVTTAKRSYCADSLFTMFKQQNYLEHGHHQWKTPVAVQPVFLKSPERVEALLYLLSAAATAYHLIQRIYRHNVANDANVLQADRRLTTESILRAFAWLPLRVDHKPLGRAVFVASLSTRQRQLLQRLNFPTPAQLFARCLRPYPNTG
jgi:transposase